MQQQLSPRLTQFYSNLADKPIAGTITFYFSEGKPVTYNYSSLSQKREYLNKYLTQYTTYTVIPVKD